MRNIVFKNDKPPFISARYLNSVEQVLTDSEERLKNFQPIYAEGTGTPILYMVDAMGQPMIFYDLNASSGSNDTVSYNSINYNNSVDIGVVNIESNMGGVSHIIKYADSYVDKRIHCPANELVRYAISVSSSPGIVLPGMPILPRYNPLYVQFFADKTINPFHLDTEVIMGTMGSSTTNIVIGFDEDVELIIRAWDAIENNSNPNIRYEITSQ